MPIEVNSTNVRCIRCGRGFNAYKGYFPRNYGALYKGTGYIPVCKSCVDSIYNVYLAQCNNAKDAVRQTCRKLDLYWADILFERIEKMNTAHTIMLKYIQSLNTSAYAGKSYDDTLSDEGTLWSFMHNKPDDQKQCDDQKEEQKAFVVAELPPIEITEDVVAFWGPGYTPEMYIELEQRLQYYRSQMGDTQQDMSTDALLRQIVMLEIDINKARADGRAVDKMMSTFNSLLSSLIKPVKKTDDGASGSSNTPLGVWIKRWEDERPLPEIDDSLKDVDGIIKYVLTWVYGHVAHMLGVRNNHSKLYDEAIEKYRVSRPEYDDEDDDTMLYDIFQDNGGSGDKTG